MIATLVGFVVPICWGFLEVLFFNAHDSVWTVVMLAAARVTCPPWLLNGFWGDIGSPFLNAALYGVLAFVICVLRFPGASRHD
jgi:hypothetical protein